jgi:hypothetical protein
VTLPAGAPALKRCPFCGHAAAISPSYGQIEQSDEMSLDQFYRYFRKHWKVRASAPARADQTKGAKA